MDKKIKQLIQANEWRKLLLAIDFGTTTIVVESVNEIKSIRTVASDINTDKSIGRQITINADRHLMLVQITVSEKTR